MQVRSTLATTTNPLVLVALTWALLWGAGVDQVPLSPGDPGSGRASTERLPDVRGVDGEVVWAEAYSHRFPGCVALALWPQHEQPVAVVTRDARAEVSRVPLAAIEHASGRVIGACR